MLLFDDFQEGLSNVSNCELEFLPAVASTPMRQNASVSIKDGEKFLNGKFIP